MKTKFIFLIPLLMFISCGKKELTEKERAHLENCVSHIKLRNESMMKDPAVGMWKFLNKLNVEVKYDSAFVTYHFKPFTFSEDKREYLDMMQQVYGKQIGCTQIKTHIFVE